MAVNLVTGGRVGLTCTYAVSNAYFYHTYVVDEGRMCWPRRCTGITRRWCTAAVPWAWLLSLARALLCARCPRGPPASRRMPS